jgi:Zn-dependent protease
MDGRSPGLRFTLFGFPVVVEPWFFIIPAFALQTRDVAGAAVWAALVFVGVLVHELGHASAMRFYGYAPWIQLHGMGGATHYPQTANPTAKQHFFITLAGPGFGLALGLVALAAMQLDLAKDPLAATAVADAVWINIGWSIINLLPVLPWDGGYLLEAGLAWLTGKRHDRIVGAVSLLVGGLVLLVAVRSASFLLGYFGVLGLVNGWRRWSSASPPH